MCTNKTVLVDRYQFSKIKDHLRESGQWVSVHGSFYQYRNIVGITTRGKKCPFDRGGKCIIKQKDVRPLACRESS